ncbi:hypothetical protein TFGA2_00484 [Neisseria gonorrhoeae]|nr:hypothetical protein TFGA2_00484 [Neisseria gonorrhoeae]
MTNRDLKAIRIDNLKDSLKIKSCRLKTKAFYLN